jgi:rhodanese-related sulfurtransferase
MSDENSGEVESVTAIEAIAAVTDGDGSTVLVDVREQDEWDRGHAPHAVHLPMSALEERYSELPEDANLLIICHSGGRSFRVTDALERAGYNAVNVEGGMLAWHAAGGAVVTDPPGQQG